MVTMRVAAFFDGRPGHEKQTRGILSRLEENVELEIFPVSVSAPSFAQQAAHLCRYFLSLSGGISPEVGGCDLLFGTGSKTHIPMLLAKKKFALPVVTCMSPASWLRSSFDLIFAPMHDSIGQKSNVFQTIGPANPNTNLGLHQDDRILILCGGEDKKSHRWDGEEFCKAVSSILDNNREKHCTLSTSPRTPPETTRLLERLAKQRERVEFYPYQQTPSGWVEKEYSCCKTVWVSADSISMVYEALSSGCHVGVIPVCWHRPQSKFSKSLQFLEKNGHIVTYEAFMNRGTGVWRDDVSLDEARRCAQEILQRFVWKN